MTAAAVGIAALVAGPIGVRMVAGGGNGARISQAGGGTRLGDRIVGAGGNGARVVVPASQGNDARVHRPGQPSALTAQAAGGRSAGGLHDHRPARLEVDLDVHVHGLNIAIEARKLSRGCKRPEGPTWPVLGSVHRQGPATAVAEAVAVTVAPSGVPGITPAKM